MSVMTIRVSHPDSRTGHRTWSDKRTVRTTKPPPLSWSMRWPPCCCPRCKGDERNGT